MFANTYQNGYFTEVWDSRVNPQKNPTYKHLFRKIPSSLKNFYDKEVKSFIYELEGNQKIFFPYDDRQQELSLHQRFIVLQIYIPVGANWSIQLGINDISSTKKRINITTTSGKQQLKYFSFRYPLESGALEKGIWMFLAFDVYSFCNAFKNAVFRSLDSIVVCGSCKIRRIFTMKQWTQFQIPKTYWLPSNLNQTMQLIEFKQSKQVTSSPNIINSSGLNSKMIESKLIQNVPSKNKNSQNSSPLQQKPNLKPTIKFPGVNNRSKDFTPLISSKLSQKIELGAKSQFSKDFGTVAKSKRSLTKADSIIQKSKFRLNSLQQKQELILSRLKSQDNQLSEKIHIKQNNSKYMRGQNMFKSDLFKSQFSESGGIDSRMSKLNNQSPKLLKVKKNFVEDNIFKQESYSSSYSRQTQKNSAQTIRNQPRTNNQIQLKKYQIKFNSNGTNDHEQIQQEAVPINTNQAFVNNVKESNVSVNARQREQIIEEDVWTDEEDDMRKPETPIEQMILSQQNPSLIPSQTIITRQNNHEVIRKQPLNTLKTPNQLELIYDQMIGCYYHPQTNTYYEIKK